MSESSTGRVFVMMPFAGEFEDIYRFGIKPAAEELGFICERADEISAPGPILSQIVSRISEADLIIVDLSSQNPNVFYELGIAHSLGKPVVLIAKQLEAIPFDLRLFRVIIYKSIRDLVDNLKRAMRDTQTHDQPLSPVLEALPRLDTVPREQLAEAERELAKFRALAAAQEAEIAALQSKSTRSPEIFALRDELIAFLKQFTDEQAVRNQETAVTSRLEIEKLRTENESLRQAEREVRRLKQMQLVNPHWKGRNLEVEKDLCFLLMPFRESWSNDVWTLVDGIVTQCGFRCRRADEDEGRVIIDDIWEGICKARVVIADLTSKNPNVTYEVGLADVLGKDVVLLSQTPNDVPFDFLGLRLITYENSIGGVRKLSEELRKRIGRFEGLPS